MKVTKFTRLTFFSALLGAFCAFGQGANALDITVYPKPLPTPPLEWTDAFGQQNYLSDYKGQVLLINFWATYCPPCIQEMPMFSLLQEKYGAQGFRVVPISLADTSQKITAFYQRYNLHNLSVYYDLTGNVATSMNVRTLPMTYLINKNGEIVSSKTGLTDWLDESVTEFIEKLLNESPSP